MEYASDECKAQVDKSVTCIKKVINNVLEKQEYFEGLSFEKTCLPFNEGSSAEGCKKIVKESIDTVCKIFEDDECKDFIEEDSVVKLINSSKCEKSGDDMILLAQIAIAKTIYLAGCRRAESGNLCPLGHYFTNTAIDFAFSNINTIERMAEMNYYRNNTNEFEVALDFGNDGLSLLSFLDDISNILENTCKDAHCNKNIIAIDNMILAAKAAYEKNQKVDLAKKFPKVFEFYNSYLDNYRNKKCAQLHVGNLNSGATTLKKMTYSLVTMIAASILLLL